MPSGPQPRPWALAGVTAMTASKAANPASHCRLPIVSIMIVAPVLGTSDINAAEARLFRTV